MNGISVIIPVYNEEKEIAKVLEKLNKVFANNDNCEIIVVNDASTDNTKEIISQFNNIKLINNTDNLGYGASIKIGLKEVKYDIVGIIDGDNTYPVEEIPKMLNFIDGYDMVVAERLRKRFYYGRANWIKQKCRDFLHLVANYLAGEKIPDLNSGLRIFKKNIILKFIDQLCDRFSFTTSLTLLMLFKRYKIKYVETDYLIYSSKSSSKVHIWRDGLKTFFMIIKLGLRYAPGRVLLLLVLFLLMFYLIAQLLNHLIA